MIKKRKKTADKAKPAKPVAPRGKNKTALKILLGMREKLLVKGLEKAVPESLRVPNEIGDEADQAGTENIRDVSILLSARNKEKLLAIEEALEKIGEGNYGICGECGEKIGPGRLRVMPLAKYCITCQSQEERELGLEKMGENDLPYREFSADGDEENNN